MNRARNEPAGRSATAALEDRSLQRRLDEVFAGVERKRVVVGFCADGIEMFAAVGADGHASQEAAEWKLPTGCITKLLLGALVADAAESGGLGPDDGLAAPLRAPRDAGALAGTTLRHLLEHTHGLDDTDLERVPMRGGFVDLDALLERLRGRRFAEPGALYSYSNAGAWILASLLEALHGQPFAYQLRANLLEPLGIAPRTPAASRKPAPANGVCPATGATLAMSAKDLLAFLWARIGADRDRRWALSSASIPGPVTELPGWSALERGIFLGWKYHGDGWLGHNSSWPGASLMARVSPRRRIALVLASRDHPAPVVAARLWADVLPEYRDLPRPKPLAASDVARIDPAAFCGHYACAAECLTIEPDAERPRALRLSGASFSTSLVPGTENIFFARPPAPGQRAFVQLVGPTGPRFRYLWDGRRVLRRVSRRPAAGRPGLGLSVDGPGRPRAGGDADR